MPKEWTGVLVGLMHTHRISFAQLAAKLGVTNRYVSMVINGHKCCHFMRCFSPLWHFPQGSKTEESIVPQQ